MEFVEITNEELMSYDGGYSWGTFWEGMGAFGIGLAIVAAPEVSVPVLIGGYITSAGAGLIVGSSLNK